MTTDVDKATPTDQKLATIHDLLLKHKGDIEMAVPKYLNPDRLIRIAVTAIASNPKLLECHPMSLLSCVIQCAQLGLEPGLIGQAYLVPFWNSKQNRRDVQFIPGYRGLLQLVRNSNEVNKVDVHEVYIGDQFDYAYGATPYLQHKPCAYKERGHVTHFYAMAILKSGELQFVVMSIEEMEQHRDDYALAKDKAGKVVGPWMDEPIEMGKKTVLRKLCKLLPQSAEKAQMAAALDDLAAHNLHQPMSGLIGIPEREPEDQQEVENRTKLSELQGKVAASSTGADHQFAYPDDRWSRIVAYLQDDPDRKMLLGPVKEQLSKECDCTIGRHAQLAPDQRARFIEIYEAQAQQEGIAFTVPT